jgi:hypothetical protein
MSVIFISYRRDDSSGHATRIYHDLAERFGEDNIFMDRGTILAGNAWANVIKGAAQQAKVFLVIIGKHWVLQRLRNPDDYVRREIEIAIKQQIPTIPLMVDGAKLPNADELPESLRNLTTRQGYWLNPFDTTSYQNDINHLKDDIARLIRETGTLVLTKELQWGNGLARLEVYIDDEKHGTIGGGLKAAGEIIFGAGERHQRRFVLPIGYHAVYVQVRGMFTSRVVKSNILNFCITGDATIRLECGWSSVVDFFEKLYIQRIRG